MSTDCTGRHVCEPESYPSALGETYRCDMCGAKFYAFDVHADYVGQDRYAAMLRNVPLGTLGWTTNKPATTPARTDSTPTEGESL